MLVKGKRAAKRNTNNNNNNNFASSSSSFRLTRGLKRKLEEKAGRDLEDEGHDNCDVDCVMMEKGCPSHRRSRSAFKHFKSETIVID